MNHIPGLRQWTSRLLLQRPFNSATHLPAAVAALALGACGAPASELGKVAATAPPAAALQIAQTTNIDERNGRIYRIHYVVTPDPAADGAFVELNLYQNSHLLREIDMRAPAQQFSNFKGDGEVAHDGERLIWRPPESGGTLRWLARVNHQRNSESFDAYMSPEWAVFRAEDIIPQAASRALRGAKSATTLTFQLPDGWSSVTEYFGRDNSYRIRNSNRRFDRPAGWILLGDIGVRYEKIADVRVNVAAPVGHGLRRMDILALMGWTLPEIVRIFPDFPGRLTIIGAADPMWRGGLSGPRSLFIYADRPLLSENATSTLVHEIIHIALGSGADSGADWIVEGLAEYYSLMVLRRSGTISEGRHASSLKKLAEWGQESDFLCAERSSGSATARAVTVFAALDEEIRRQSRNKFSLDDVIRALAGSDNDITIHSLLTGSSEFLSSDSAVLSPENLPGCEL